jgi:hypothetical protein
MCVHCGGVGEPKCASSSPCAPGYTPEGDLCTPCGGDGEPVCA